MNALPLILTFLLIFSVLSTGFLRGQKTSLVAQKCSTRFYHTNRCVSNRITERYYRKIKVDTSSKASKDKKKGVKRSTTPFVFTREHLPPLETSKLNLTPLLETKTDPKRHPLYEIAAELLRLLYKDKLFKKEQDWEYALLDSFCATQNPQKLIDLYPIKTTLQPLFYKMLKGTHHYDLKTAEGIAPLEHFFTLGQQSAIHFCFASPLLLQATFGKKIAEKIIAEEDKKERKSPLTQDEFASLLINDPACSSLITELDSELNFSKKQEKRKALSGIDKKSNLTITKPF